jgi:glycosyltransferase involved in cell wall biosynthesis
MASKHSFVNNTAIEIASKYNFSDNDKIIIYQGDVTIDRNLDLFLDSLYTLPFEYKFLIIGDGVAVPLLSIKYNLFVNSRLFFTGRIANTDLPYYTRLGKIGIVSYPFTGLNNIFCSPNKVYEYAQSGLILLSTGQKTLQNMIDKYNIGLYILESDKTIDITNKIVSLFHNFDNFQNNLNKFINENLWESEIKEYKNILNKMITS